MRRREKLLSIKWGLSWLNNARCAWMAALTAARSLRRASVILWHGRSWMPSVRPGVNGHAPIIRSQIIVDRVLRLRDARQFRWAYKSSDSDPPWITGRRIVDSVRRNHLGNAWILRPVIAHFFLRHADKCTWRGCAASRRRERCGKTRGGGGVRKRELLEAQTGWWWLDNFIRGGWCGYRLSSVITLFIICRISRLI